MLLFVLNIRIVAAAAAMPTVLVADGVLYTLFSFTVGQACTGKRKRSLVTDPVTGEDEAMQFNIKPSKAKYVHVHIYSTFISGNLRTVVFETDNNLCDFCTILVRSRRLWWTPPLRKARTGGAIV